MTSCETSGASGILTRRSLVGMGAALTGSSLIGVHGAALAATPARSRLATTHSGRVKVHTYTAPEKGWQVTTQIVELSDQLIVVDGQYLLPYGREAAAFCKSLNKPISRLYITHFHPDHHLGAEAFGAPVYALADVKAKIIAIGDRLAREESAKFPDEPGIIPAHAIRPEFEATAGTETISGETFQFDVVRHAEADPSLVVGLPEHRILIAQDLVYNRIHLFLGEKNFDGWTAALETWRAKPYDRILPGHGVPTGPKVYEEMIGYLAFAKQALAEAKDGPSFEQTLIRRYPDWGGRALLEHERRFLFKAA